MQKQPGTEREDSAHITGQPGSTPGRGGASREAEQPRADPPKADTQNPHERHDTATPGPTSTDRG